MTPRRRRRTSSSSLLGLAALPVVACLQSTFGIQVAPPADTMPATVPAATAPATAPAEALELIVSEVRGLAEIREAPGQPWKKAERGQRLQGVKWGLLISGGLLVAAGTALLVLGSGN